MTAATMALFGMVWLLRMRAEMRRCSKCRREGHTPSDSTAPIFTVEGASVDPPAPGTYCEVHGYVPRKEGKVILEHTLYFVS